MHTVTYNSNIVIILCTLPNDKNYALKLIKTLLNLKLAACITLSNEVCSFYHWNNKLETTPELQLIIKTKSSLKNLLFNKIKELHPYKIPELLVIPVIDGEQKYLHWIQSNV